MNFPDKTKLHRIMDKAKFAKMSELSTIVRKEFQANVDRLVLANILRKDTINIESGKEIQEIDVLEISLKKKQFSDNLIKEIEVATPKYLIIVLKFQQEAQLAICYKEKNKNNDKYKVMQIYRTDWMPYESMNLSIDGLNLDTVFYNFITQIADGKIEVEKDGNIKEAVEKSIDIQKLQNKINQLESKINKETQFNIQLKLKKELKVLQEQMRSMTNG